MTRTTPLGKTDTRRYDLNGNLTSFVDRRGQTSVLTYDALNRVVGESYQDGSRVARFYDASSRLVRVDDSIGGIFTFTYDLNGRLTSSTGPFGTVRYTYDDAGRILSRQVIGQPPVDYTYDDAGNLRAARTSGAAVTFDYDAHNRLLSVNRANGVSTRYAYDPLGRLLSLMDARGSDMLNEQRYTYDAAGDRTRYTANIGRPLITEAATSRYDADNRLLQRGATTYIYDENGNLVSETEPRGTTIYRWDPRNRLHSISTPDGQTTTFRYDFASNLVQQQDAGPGSNLTQNLVLDGLTNVVFQSNSNGDQFSILTGQGTDQHLAVIRPGGRVEYGLADAINSTIATIDQSGSIQARFYYEPFGQTDSTDGRYPFQYTGRAPISASLYYYRARYYDALAGRFISEDPIGFLGGLNLYRYVNNDPMLLTDPTGLVSVALSAYAGGGAGIKLSFTSQGVSYCSELGIGVGGALEVDPSGGLDRDDFHITSEATAGLGPAEVKAGWQLDTNCGLNPIAQGCILHVCGKIGPAGPSLSVKGPVEELNTALRKDLTKMLKAPPKGFTPKLQAKLVGGTCRQFKWR
jgi:RHS repeat-associated protein